jgi:hypothetical protein
MKFNDAIKHSVNYLKSKEFTEREDAITTIPTIDKLVELNKHGLLTYDSQVGKKDQYNTERAYINGFMEREKAEQLMQYVMIHTDKIMYIVGSVSDKKWMDNPIFKRSESIPLTISTKTKEVETTMTTILPEEIVDFERKLVRITKNSNIVPVFCFDPIWGRYTISKNGLLNDILRCISNMK